MSGPGAGFEYPAREVTWLKRDALLFANSIGATADELHFLFVSKATVVASGHVLIKICLLGTSSQVRCLPDVLRHLAYAHQRVEAHTKTR